MISLNLLPLNAILSVGKIKLSKGAKSHRTARHFVLPTSSYKAVLLLERKILSSEFLFTGHFTAHIPADAVGLIVMTMVFSLSCATIHNAQQCAGTSYLNTLFLPFLLGVEMMGSSTKKAVS